MKSWPYFPYKYKGFFETDLKITISCNFLNSYSILKIFGSGEWENFIPSNAYFSNFIRATLKNPFQSLP